jgi:hypothetical protein
MPSPFPGMNPYLEQDDVWHDFHEKALPAIAEQLVRQVVPAYIVKIDEHIYVHELPPEPRRWLGRPDVLLATEPASASARIGMGLLEAPAQVRLPAQDVERLAFVEIRDRKSRELITVVELLSPSNKRSGGDREQYLSKRETILGGRVNLVELDLLRGGRPMPMTGRPDCDYAVLVSRPDDRPNAGFWPIRLRDPLPVIPIPLRPEDGDARLELQELIHRVYDASGYEYYIYRESPDPPLTPVDAAWASQFVPAGDWGTGA